MLKRVATPKPGDIVQIPLPMPGVYICQHIKLFSGVGYLFAFFRCPDGWQLQHGLGECELLFQPISVAMREPLRTERWKKIGNLPVDREYDLRYISGGPLKEKGGTPWWYKDESQSLMMGYELPLELQHLEYAVTLSADSVESRLTTGVNKYAYSRMQQWATPLDAS